VFELQRYHYERFAPPPALRGVVDHFWVFRGPAPGASLVQQITPMGYGEIVLHYGDLYARRTDSAFRTEDRNGLFGPIQYSQQLRPLGTIDLLAVRFTPLGLHRICGVPATELTGGAFAIGELLSCRQRELWRTVAHAEPSDRLACLHSALEALVRGEPTRADIRTAWVLSQVQHHPQIRFEALAKLAGISLRQMEYDFARCIGLSPREYSATLRIERAVEQLLGHEYGTLSRLALELGYHDHAQFTRDFTHRVGMSPRAFRKGNLGAFFFRE
jgi:AraC-like DNA-binding protein